MIKLSYAEWEARGFPVCIAVIPEGDTYAYYIEEDN